MRKKSHLKTSRECSNRIRKPRRNRSKIALFCMAICLILRLILHVIRSLHLIHKLLTFYLMNFQRISEPMQPMWENNNRLPHLIGLLTLDAPIICSSIGNILMTTESTRQVSSLLMVPLWPSQAVGRSRWNGYSLMDLAISFDLIMFSTCRNSNINCFQLVRQPEKDWESSFLTTLAKSRRII